MTVMEEYNKTESKVFNSHSHLMHGEGEEGSMFKILYKHVCSVCACVRACVCACV